MYTILGWIEKLILKFKPEYKMIHFAEDCLELITTLVIIYIIFLAWKAVLILIALWFLRVTFFWRVR